jgi:beta-phosphoglucomutase family hydrolase
LTRLGYFYQPDGSVAALLNFFGLADRTMFVIEPHVRGLIFDWDGTIIDTMPVHYLAWVDTVQQLGADFPEYLFYDLAGVPSDRIVEVLNEKFGYNLDPQETAAAKERLFVEKYLARANLIEPVLNVARQYKGKMPMAVATGGIPPVLNKAMAQTGLTGFFDAVVTADDVEHGKPAPDTFLEAARRIGVAPELCQVFEDSDAGLEGARRAGMVATDIRSILNGSK